MQTKKVTSGYDFCDFCNKSTKCSILYTKLLKLYQIYPIKICVLLVTIKERFSSRFCKLKSILRVPSVDVLIALVTSALVIAVTKFEREGFVRIGE